MPVPIPQPRDHVALSFPPNGWLPRRNPAEEPILHGEALRRRHCVVMRPDTFITVRLARIDSRSKRPLECDVAQDDGGRADEDRQSEGRISDAHILPNPCVKGRDKCFHEGSGPSLLLPENFEGVDNTKFAGQGQVGCDVGESLAAPRALGGGRGAHFSWQLPICIPPTSLPKAAFWPETAHDLCRRCDVHGLTRWCSHQHLGPLHIISPLIKACPSNSTYFWPETHTFLAYTNSWTQTASAESTDRLAVTCSVLAKLTACSR